MYCVEGTKRNVFVVVLLRRRKKEKRKKIVEMMRVKCSLFNQEEIRRGKKGRKQEKGRMIEMKEIVQEEVIEEMSSHFMVCTFLFWFVQVKIA